MSMLICHGVDVWSECMRLWLLEALTARCPATQFTKAVEAKQVAQQDAERARFVVLKADQVRHTCCSVILKTPGLGPLTARAYSCPIHTFGSFS